MRLKFLSTLLFIFVILVGLIKCQKMQDFSYAQVMVEQKQVQSNKINIYPQASIFDHYEFPKACEIDVVFSTKQQSERPLPQMSNIDGQIQFLKNKTSEFLRLADKVELLTRNLKNLPEPKYNSNFEVKQQQFQVIQQQQKKLKQINSKINEKTLQLQNIVNQMMLQKESHLFKQAALSFQKKALQQKIVLFDNLLSQAKVNQQQVVKAANQQHLTNYFNQLQTIFDAQNNLIQTIDTLLKNHNQLAQIKAKVTSLQAQLKAYDLTINEKQQCNSQFIKIQQKQSYDKDLIRLIQILKVKKSQFTPNKYCQGVVEKLIQRIRRLVSGYDYIWTCKEGLEQMKREREQIDKELQEAKQKQDELQMSKSVNAFRREFEHNRGLVQDKIDQISGLKLDDYYKDPAVLQNIAKASQSRIQQIQNQVSLIPVKSTQQLATLQKLIQQKIQDIKKLKANYCRQNEDYVINTKIIQDRLYKFEQQQDQNAWISNVQQEKLKQLEGAKLRMAEIQVQIQDYLEMNKLD